ncbi:MAG TPA: hypothetical protein VJJ02_04165 [Candidatus Paceibacterota bacterium]
MSDEEGKQQIAYEKEVIFRLVAELHFSLTDIDPSFSGAPEDELILGENDDLTLSDPSDEDVLPLSPPILLEEAFDNVCDGLFRQYLRLYEALVAPFLENMKLKKEFEEWSVKEYGFQVPLVVKQKEGPRLTIVPSDPQKTT